MEHGHAPLYHGTNVSGITHILPAAQHGKAMSYEGESDPHYAYATPNLDDAWEYAMEAHGQDEYGKHPGRPRVYEVHPIGGHHHVEQDPAYNSAGVWRGTRNDDRRSPVGFHVGQEMPPPEHVKQWYHRNGDDWHPKD